MIRTHYLSVLAVVLHGCASATNVNPTVDLTNEALTVRFYEGGRVSMEKVLPPGSPGATTISAIIDGKRGKWTRSFATFAPVVLVRGKNFTINFQSGRVILDFTGADGKPDQMLAPLADGEFATISQLRT